MTEQGREDLPRPSGEQRPEIHHAHRDVTGGWLRPAVFGVMDGLVSNFALISGVAGSGAGTRIVIVTGIAGLVAGACSMASGEYVSVASQGEMTEAEIETEKRELTTRPKDEERELAYLFQARGVSEDVARQVARDLSADPEIAWRVHVREELGVDPDALPSPWLAASSSFAAFSLGALIPVLPFLLGATGLTGAILVSALGLFGTGAAVARLTVKRWWAGGLRQLLLGGTAAAVTFGIGHLVGVGLS